MGACRDPFRRVSTPRSHTISIQAVAPRRAALLPREALPSIAGERLQVQLVCEGGHRRRPLRLHRRKAVARRVERRVSRTRRLCGSGDLKAMGAMAVRVAALGVLYSNGTNFESLRLSLSECTSCIDQKCPTEEIPTKTPDHRK